VIRLLNRVKIVNARNVNARKLKGTKKNIKITQSPKLKKKFKKN